MCTVHNTAYPGPIYNTVCVWCMPTSGVPNGRDHYERGSFFGNISGIVWKILKEFVDGVKFSTDE